MNCPELDKLLEQKCRQALAKPKPENKNVETFKELACANGCGSIANIGRKFKIMDDDRSRSLSYEEFEIGCREVMRHLRGKKPHFFEDVFSEFDKNGNGTIDYDEFLSAVRPEMSQKRKDKVMEVFAKMDRDKSGVINVEDMLGFYDFRQHPKYKNGEFTDRQVYEEFLKSFQGDNPDDQVTLEEWHDYYSGISASIDDDAYFLLMMEQCWNRKPSQKGTAFLHK